MKIKPIGLAIGVCLSIIACNKNEFEDYKGSSVVLDLKNDNFQYEGTTNDIGKLGRVLFYDQSLSVNNSTSCGSCHIQELAFSDKTALSKGFENFTTSRNTPPIQNLNSNTFLTPFFTPMFNNPVHLFWDGRETSLQNMVLKPIFNHVEMGIGNISELVKKVKERSYYNDLFVSAFGSEEVTPAGIAMALAGFTGSMVSRNSKFDLSNARFSFPSPNQVTNFTALEQEGFELFLTKYECATCHDLSSSIGYNPENPSLGEFVSIGLEMNPDDLGRALISKKEEDKGKFKIPNLRNVMLTAPYMHDGRFETLDEVFDHYSDGIQNTSNLDERLQDKDGEALRLNIKQQDREALIAFMHTLTDNELISNPKFSNPFINQ